MKKPLLLLAILILFTGCKSDEEKQRVHDAQIAKQARSELLAELKAKELKAKTGSLSQLGISKNEGVIRIDTNQTKTFFKNIATQMQTKVQKLSDDIREGHMVEKEAGIEIDASHVNIDLNKTKSFLESFTKRMQTFAKEFDTITQNLETQTEGK
jgi:hypothetical protein